MDTKGMDDVIDSEEEMLVKVTDSEEETWELETFSPEKRILPKMR
jgi:hypothetical protein